MKIFKEVKNIFADFKYNFRKSPKALSKDRYWVFDCKKRDWLLISTKKEAIALRDKPPYDYVNDNLDMVPRDRVALALIRISYSSPSWYVTYSSQINFWDSVSESYELGPELLHALFTLPALMDSSPHYVTALNLLEDLNNYDGKYFIVKDIKRFQDKLALFKSKIAGGCNAK